MICSLHRPLYVSLSLTVHITTNNLLIYFHKQIRLTWMLTLILTLLKQWSRRNILSHAHQLSLSLSHTHTIYAHGQYRSTVIELTYLQCINASLIWLEWMRDDGRQKGENRRERARVRIASSRANQSKIKWICIFEWTPQVCLLIISSSLGSHFVSCFAQSTDSLLVWCRCVLQLQALSSLSKPFKHLYPSFICNETLTGALSVQCVVTQIHLFFCFGIVFHSNVHLCRSSNSLLETLLFI